MTEVSLQQEVENAKVCLRCNKTIALQSKFCRYCGASQRDDDKRSGGFNNVKHVALLYAFDLTICLIATCFDVFKTFTWSAIFDLILAIVAVTFFCDGWKKNKTILKWPNFSIFKLLGYGSLAVIASLIVSFCVGWLNHALFSKEFYYYGLYAGKKYAPFLMIFFIAVMPALFEELAYRGYVLQNLLSVTDTKQAVFITSFLFAIMHLSYLSLFWLIPFALALGYVRIKEKTLWYGVFMHFCFNLTVCVIELIKYR